MIRLIFSAILIFHGLLHFIGLAREWGLGTHHRLGGTSLSGSVDIPSKIAGLLWLLSGILFLTAAAVYLLRRDWYWMPAAAGLLLSQTLLIIYWQEARYGTIVNAIILVVVILGAAATHFKRMVGGEVKSLRSAARHEQVITDEMIAGLPPNVRQWMHRSNVVGKRNPAVIRITQKGKMRLAPDGKWMPFDAVQYFSTNPPAFVWEAKVKSAPLIPIVARDRFMDGRGEMLIKPAYLFTAARSTGPEINEGTLLRYLAEMVWFPQAAVSDYLAWKQINDHQASVSMNYGGALVSGTYSFDEAGDVAAFEAMRYGDFGGAYRKELWSIKVTGHKTIDGRRVGNTSEVTWKLKEGDFTWLKVEITDIKPL